jgi:phage-related protein
MGILSGLFDWFTDFFKGLLSTLQNEFLWVFAVTLPVFAGINLVSAQVTSWILDAALWIWDATGNLLESLWGSILGFVEGAIEWILTLADKLITFVADEIAAILTTVGSAIFGSLGPFVLVALGLWFLINKGDDNNGTNPA